MILFAVRDSDNHSVGSSVESSSGSAWFLTLLTLRVQWLCCCLFRRVRFLSVFLNNAELNFCLSFHIPEFNVNLMFVWLSVVIWFCFANVFTSSSLYDLATICPRAIFRYITSVCLDYFYFHAQLWTVDILSSCSLQFFFPSCPLFKYFSCWV